MAIKTTEFYPFYDPNNGNGTFSYPVKSFISLGLGSLYIAAQYWAMPDKMTFFSQYCWILGAIISTSIMALYLATDVFRSSLNVINSLQGDNRISAHIVSNWLSDSRYLLAGLFWGTANVTVAHLLGIPGDLHSTPMSLSMMYVGFFVSGFAAGMGVLAIVAVIALYLKLAPNLQHLLNPDDPDGYGGIKKLGDSLWFFAMLIAAVGILVSVYMFGVQWEFMHLAYVRWTFLLWISLPYLVAISIVLIPGLAVRRHVSDYKSYSVEQLKLKKAALYSDFKSFENSDDESIINRKKEISLRLNQINDQMEKLRKMRSSHIDSNENL